MKLSIPQFKSFAAVIALSMGLVFGPAGAKDSKALFVADPLQALQLRVNLISRAQSEILVEYFSVWNDDQSVQILGQLLRAARRGVKVKFMVDALASKMPKPLIAALTGAGQDGQGNENFQIRYYNPINIIKLGQAFHREHAKLLIIDGQYLVTGGRNIGDKYFGFNQRRNFVDSDVLVNGSAASEARENFLASWSGKMAKEPELYQYRAEKLSKDSCLLDSGRGDRSQCERDVELANKKVEEQLKRAETGGQDLLASAMGANLMPDSGEDVMAQAISVSDIDFISHSPHTLVNKKNNFMTQDMAKLIRSAKHTILISSPYLLLNDELESAFQDILNRPEDQGGPVQVRVLTNSIKSTDNILAQVGYRSVKKKLIAMGFEIYEYNGPDTAHSKLIVIDGHKTVIGSYNFNKRSAEKDREVGVVITEDENSHPFADQVAAKIEGDIDNSLLVAKDKLALNQEQWAENDPNLPATTKNLMRIFTLFLPILINNL